MCEVMNVDMTPHSSNTRAALVESASNFSEFEPWFGMEQEYTLLNESDKPLGFPDVGEPAPQGDYYCSAGNARTFGRNIAEEHMRACLYAGLMVSGINAEVCPGQWEYQIGPLDTVTVSDQMWVARYIMERVTEMHNTTVSWQGKPMEGDWNGAGAHANFSTKAMREDGGYDVVVEACEKIGKNIDRHISVYGAKNDERLTGLHETAKITEFFYGVSDRGASIRIPMATANSGKGYLEDRRPAANMDPYLVCAALVETTCG